MGLVKKLAGRELFEDEKQEARRGTVSVDKWFGKRYVVGKFTDENGNLIMLEEKSSRRGTPDVSHGRSRMHYGFYRDHLKILKYNSFGELMRKWVKRRSIYDSELPEMRVFSYDGFRKRREKNTQHPKIPEYIWEELSS